MTAPTWKETPWGQELETEHGIIRLERRPEYCDRGAFLAHVEPKHDAACKPCNVDAHDLFPRFYYDEGRAKLELDAFMRRRKWIADDAPATSSPLEGAGTYGALATLVMDRAKAAAVILIVKGGKGCEDGFEIQADLRWVQAIGGRVAFQVWCLTALSKAIEKIMQESPLDTSDPDPGS
jgi:hypothetical protein